MYLLLSLALLFVLVFLCTKFMFPLSLSPIGDSHSLILNRYLIFANTQLCPSLSPAPHHTFLGN